MYSALVEGKYWWLKGDINYFPVFTNLFRKNDRYVDFETQIDQAAGIFFRWLWTKSKIEIYSEFYHNDSKHNLRDLILDSDHSRAVSLGLQKILKINNDNFLLNWEWTQMEQNASRLIRNAGSWYEHAWIYDGFTNKGEVLGSSIGPGSNSQYISISRLRDDEIIGFHLNYKKSFKHFNLSTNLVYIRSLNYQWELDDFATPYYHPGRDVDNFHLSLKLTYFGDW